MSERERESEKSIPEDPPIPPPPPLAPQSQNPHSQLDQALPSVYPTQPQNFKQALFQNPEKPSTHPNFHNLPCSTTPPPELSADEIFIPLNEDLCSSLCKEWSTSLIGKVIGKSFSYDFLNEKLVTTFVDCGNWTLQLLGKGFFVLKFAKYQDMQQVLSGGPWTVNGFPLFLRLWEPGFKPSMAKIDTATVWVTLPELPIECYNEGILKTIGNAIGRLVKIDTKSVSRERTRFARLLVQVSLEKPPPKFVWIGKIKQEIQVQDTTKFCKWCKCYGHSLVYCKRKPISTVEGKTQTEDVAAESEWKMVNRKKSKEKNISDHSKRAPSNFGKKFQIANSRGKWDQAHGPKQSDKTQVLGSHTPLPQTSPSLHVTTLSLIPTKSKPLADNIPTYNSFQTLPVETPLDSPSSASIASTTSNGDPIPRSITSKILEMDTIPAQSPLLSSTPPSTPQSPSPPLPPLPKPFSLSPLKTAYLLFSQPPQPISSELDFNKVDFLMDTQVIEDLRVPTPTMLRSFIRNLSQVPNEWKDLMMLDWEGDLHPAHLPDRADARFFTSIMTILFTWGMNTLDKKLSTDLIPRSIIRLMDPPPVLPKERKLILLEDNRIVMEAASWAEAMALITTTKQEERLQLAAKWQLGKAPEEGNSILISMAPTMHSLCEHQKKESCNCLMEGKVPRERKFLSYPAIDPRMVFLYWNARGIARPSFLDNMRLLIQQHKPHLLILSEIRVSKNNAEDIFKKLPFDEWVISETVGLSGGIVVIWNSDFVNFEATRVNRQGIHGILKIFNSLRRL
ncbi:Homogentisate 1 2-dioxygenase [Bienertia sinuspersici]